MKFGKEFRTHLEETLPEWRDKFLCYKPLKKLLKNLPSTLDSFSSDSNHDDGDQNNNNNNTVPHSKARPPLLDLQDWFVRILNEELEKFNDFYIDKEEEFIIRFQELKERIEQIRDKMEKEVESTSDGEFSEELMEIRKDFVTIHGEMVLLKNYSSLNFAGLVKILKKYDKRTGGLLQLPFTQLALHQPFFTTEPLTRLVHECEANLELLFPSEAEVVESSLMTRCGLVEQPTTDTNEDMPLQTPTTLGEETRDIYRSTLAAMRTIKGLQKASSTYNPFSISYFYSMKDEDSASGVTAENSISNSPSMSQDRGDAN